ncbi:MAG: SDR family oxidoreductase [Verrucomicrobiales bacterium]|nr:SDR family oxidoreductase [Verrucomicrobiota bacterium JB025]
MSYSIQNKVALVTGANRGIGKSIVETFLSHGADKVYLAVRNPESTKDLEAKFGGKVTTLRADISDPESIKRLAQDAPDVDILVNNAGVMELGAILGEDAGASLARQLEVNVFGLQRIASAFADILAGRHGALVQLNSIASIKSFPNLAAYSASKAASYSLTQGLRHELAGKGVSVLSVHPGPIDTEMGAAAGFEGTPVSVVAEGIVKSLAAGDFHLFPDEMAKQFEAAYQGFSDAIVTANLSE